MFSWNFAKSAEAMFSQWAIKKVCKFLLKKKLGQLIIGDIDLNQLDVQLSSGTIQLSDLVLNVDYINNKFGTAAILVVKEGSIGSLLVKLPWKGRGCEIEVDELELVLAPAGNTHFQGGAGTSSSGQNDNGPFSPDLMTHEHEMADSTLTTSSVDIHEGVKTIAKMVKWLLTSFHVKVKKLIVALDPSGELKNNGICRTLVLRLNEVECGTGISEDVDLNCQATADRFLGLSRLTNFGKFDGAVLEFLQLDGDDSQSAFPTTSGEAFGEWFSGYSSSMATTPIITGGEGGFSGTIRLSIPWKNGSLDIRKVDADVYVDPLELRLQPSSLKSFMYLVHVLEEVEKNRKNFMQCESMESVYESAASHDHSSTLGSFEFDTDKLSHMPDTFSVESYSSSSKDTVFDALLRGSHLISDWVTSPIGINQDRKPEESDFGASVDQFFECFDELRTSQSALGNSGMWNWTCSVFSAITAASNLASGSLHIPSELKHVETSLKARITQIVILFSFVDEEDKPSCGLKGSKTDSTSHVHYINANFHEMQLVCQVCPRELNFEATVKHIEVADHFSHVHDFSTNKEAKAMSLSIRNKQAAVQSACPPLGSLVQGAINSSSNTCSRNCRGIYRDDVVKVLLLQTSASSQIQYVATSVSRDGRSAGQKSFSIKLPPLIFWVNFSLISTALDLWKEIGNSLEISSKNNLYPSVDGNSKNNIMGSPEETLRGNISLMDARIILCFPCEKSEDSKSYLSWNQFFIVDFSSPLASRDEKFRQNNPPLVPILKERYSVTTSRSLHFNVANFTAYIITSASKDKNYDSVGIQMLKFHAENVLSVSDKAGRPSVFSMLWQESSVTGPWITKRAKVLATSDSTGSRNKSTGKGHEFASVATTKNMEDFNSRTREEIVLSSSFLLHAHLSPITVNLDSCLYKKLDDLLHHLADCLSCIASDPVETTEIHSPSQTSILMECESVEISISVKPVEDIKGSIQNELPGSWCSLKLRVEKFELLNVSSIGGIQGANFLWVAHGEGNLWGSTTGAPNAEFVLISCKNSSRGRGNGEGSNLFSSRFPGSDIIHMWDPENFVSQLSINIRCATIVATGGRLDWFIALLSFFSSASTEDEQVHEKENLKNDTNCGSSFVLNLIDIGLSYEPHSSDNMDEQYVAGLLAASTLKFSNVSTANSIETDYKIKAYDMGLLLCEVSEQNKLGGSYGEQDLRKSGYVKVAEEAHVEADLRMNCNNGRIWEVECCESHIVLETCQDTAFGLIRLASQLQKIYAPDVEESMVHLQSRWDTVQQAQESYKSRSSSNHFTSSSQVHSVSLDTKSQTSTVNLMDEISEGAFSLNRDSDYHPGEVPAFSSGDHESLLHRLSFTGPVPEFIEGYFLSDLRPLSELPLNSKESLSAKSRTTKDTEARGGISGWYGDSPLKILENHVGEKTKSKKLKESEASVSQTENAGCRKVNGQVLLENINIRWRLYAGNDWQFTQTNVQNGGRDTTVCLELALLKMGIRYDVFPDGELWVSRLSLSVEDMRLNDVSNDAPWIQVLSGYQSKDHPRESCSRALKLDLEAVRPHPSTPLEEYRLKIALFPLRLHLHQSQLDFLVNFFGGKNSSLDQPSSPHVMGDPKMPQNNKIYQENHDIKEEALLPFFQKFSISPVLVRVDYSPSHVDLAALRRGKYVELVNLVPWKGVELQLKHVQAVGVYGWSSVGETIIGEWLEDISHNQIRKILKGLPPIRSLVAVGSSAAKLVSLPVKNYRKDRRIVKGMQRGTIAFLRSISLEAIGLGVHLAAGAHDVLLQAEYILTSVPPSSVPRPLQSRSNPNVRSNQPTDARQGIQQAFESITDGLGKSASALVQTPLKKYQRGASMGSALSTAVQAAPGAAIAPASAAARAMHSALLGVRNSLDPEHKKESMDKYLGATQSQPRYTRD